jgi:hypothetical protein
MMTETTTLREKIQDQIDSIEKGLRWLKEGTISTSESSLTGSHSSRDAEMIEHYERILVALRKMLAESP